MPTHEKGPAADGANPKGYNTVDRPLTKPLASNCIARDAMRDSALQRGMTRSHLQLAAASLFTKQLGMRVLPDWGVDLSGLCQCGSKRTRKATIPGDPVERGCRNPGKHPAIKVADGRALRSYSEARMGPIMDWVRLRRNLAVVPFGHLVIDIDTGDGLDAFVGWCQLAGLDSRAMLYDTLVVRSGSGSGLHLYYALPPGSAPPDGGNAWLPHVDVKTQALPSDKITIPGSLHTSGNRYEFAVFNDPLRAPDVLVEEVRAGRAYELTSVGATRILRPGEPRVKVPTVGFGSTLDPAYAAFVAAHPARKAAK